MLYKVLLILSHMSMISGSMVLDSISQRSIYVTDYCPKMKFCPEGAHVMCMYYNAKSIMGPRCSNAQNISMTPDLANKLLDVSNAVRSRIAQGKEKGKDGKFLPRGYGIFKLHWDTEMATFAQVLANQCVLRHDMCRATNRFPDPGQTAGLVRFSYPDWFPVSKSGNFTIPGMSQDKLMYATTQILKSWYGQKNAVSPTMITFYPDWTLTPNSQNGRLYLEMIYGSATHMGCGISAYTEYAFYDNNAALTYNSVQIICNYSARPRKGAAVYNTVPPGDTAEPFSKCGCPVGSEADDECLCHEVDRQPKYLPTQLKQKTHSCPEGQNCDPTVVVLPIFTVEDAPPEKLFNRDSFRNASLRKPTDNNIYQSSQNEVFYSKRNFYGPGKIENKPQAYDYNGKTSQRQSRLKQNIRPTSHHKEIAIKNRYFDKKHVKVKPQESSRLKKTSLFSRAAKFELPGARSMRPIKTAGIKDVAPRKDFSNAKQLVNKYLYEKNDFIKHYKNNNKNEQRIEKHEGKDTTQALEERNNERVESHRNNNINEPLFKDIYEEKTTVNELPKTRAVVEHDTLKNIIESDHYLHEVFNILNSTNPLKAKEIAFEKTQKLTTESVLNTAEQKVIIQDAFLKEIVSNTKDYNSPFNSVTEETDNKLMALLDTLEREIKHIELRDKDKQLFDAKIRKIYGKVVGKPVSLINLNINKPMDSKTNKKYLDVKDSYIIMQKSIQQDPTKKSLYDKYKSKMDGPDGLLDKRLETNYKNSYRNSSTTRDQHEIDKYDERNSYNKKYGARGMKHSDLSNEQLRNRYHDYANDHEYGERKTYRNNDFDRNTLNEDEARYRGTDSNYRVRNNEKDQYHREDELEHRNANELEHRGRRLESHIRNDEIDQTVKNKNYYLNNDGGNNDPLSVERRRFYQEKLDNIERRLQMRNHKRRKDKPRHMRPMRPVKTKSENQMDIYGRARFAHGY